MSFPRARPIDAVYDDVAGHDLVLVPDAPLASALNRRLDRPHLGTFATTPRRLTAGRREEYTTVDLFTDRAFDLPPFHVFDSSAALVDALLEIR